MQEQIRVAARKHLPPAIRRPAGALAGLFQFYVVHYILGLIFDIKGGRFRANGCQFIIPKEASTRRFRQCFIGDTYERDERDLIRQLLRPEDSVLELGACIGVVSCVTNKLLADKSRHVVVEANPFCIPTLYVNKEINGAGFLIEHCAVAAQPEVTFYLHPHFMVGGTVARPSQRPCRVPAKSLRQLERERGPFSVLVIDIEGSEREVFEESADLLGNYRLVIVELHDWAIGNEGTERCREILRGCGLRRAGSSGITEAWQRD